MAVRRGPNRATASMDAFFQSFSSIGQMWTQVFTAIAQMGNSLMSQGTTGGYGGGYGGGGYYKMVTDFFSGLL